MRPLALRRHRKGERIGFTKPILGWGIGLAFHGEGACGGGAGAIAREEQKLRETYRRG